MVDAFKRIKLPDCTPEATIYLWQKTPEGMTSVDFAKKLLSPDIAIVTTPGAWISDKTESGLNPGEGYVRFALVPSIKKYQRGRQADQKNTAEYSAKWLAQT